jgi:outer membrane protein assembly factor BamA
LKIKFLYLIIFLLEPFLIEGQNKCTVDIYLIQDGFSNALKINTLEGVSDSVAVKKALEDQLSDYYEKGFLAASFDSIERDSVCYKAYLNPGKAYKWAKLNFDSIPAIVLKRISTRPDALNNTLIKPSVYKSLCEKIISFYENNGYPFASLSLNNVEIHDEGIEALVILKKNGFFTIDSVTVKGKAKISGNFINHYLDLKKGDPYSEKKIKQIKKRINQLPYLRQIRPAEVSFGKNKAIVYNYLDNAKANHFNGIVGIAPNATTGNVSVTGEVEISLLNPLGKGESVSFHWKKLVSSSQSLDAGLVLPYVFKSPVGADFNLTFYKQDSSWLTLDLKAGVRFPFDGANYFKLFIEKKSSSIIASSTLASLTVLPSYADSRSLMYGTGIYYNSLDYAINPRRGMVINSELATGERKIIKNSNINSSLYDGVSLSSTQFSGLAHIEFYKPLSKKMVVKLQNQSGFISNKTILTNEMYKLGGLNSLRGFDDTTIVASSYTIFTVELRYLFEQNSNVYVFFDGCYYEKNLTGAYLADTPIGFGVGTNFETKAGIFSLAYAVGRQLGNQISLGSAKIHFGFINRF